MASPAESPEATSSVPVKQRHWPSLSSDGAALLVTLAFGVLINSVGYAMSRAGEHGAFWAFVIGQFLIVGAPVVYVVRRRAISPGESLWCALGVGLSSFLACFNYAPTRFLFEDELQHTRTAQSILTSHHLFGINSSLVVSPKYPGLEIVTTALASLSHLSIFSAGMIVSGICHIAMVVLLCLLGLELGLKPRAAAIATLVFAAGFDFQFFLSYFAYQTFAMPFMIATVLFAVRALNATSHRTAIVNGAGAVSVGAVTITSHHVTSYFLAFTLCGMMLALVRSTTFNWKRLGLILVPLLAILGAWNLLVARETVSYLKQIKDFLIGTTTSPLLALSRPSSEVRHWVSTGGVAHFVQSALPIRILSDLGALIIGVALLSTLTKAWRQRVFANSLIAPLAVISFAFFFFTLVALVSPGADQLVGRGLALVLVPVSIVAAFVLNEGPISLPVIEKRWKLDTRRMPVLSVGLIVITVGGVLAGWPALQAKLPAPYQVAAFERSTDQRTTTLASWSLATFGDSPIFAATHRESLIIQAISGQSPAAYPAGLFETESFRPIDAQLVQRSGIRFVIADQRMVRQIPAEGAYFAKDPLALKFARPLPAMVLGKFNTISGVQRIFDDGVIVIYDLSSSRYWEKRAAK